MTTTSAWIILTLGDRPEALRVAIDSIRRSNESSHPADNIVVVANGAEGDIAEPDLGELHIVSLSENVGVPAGRNAGMAATVDDIVFFLDDDAAVITPELQQTVLDQFRSDPSLAVVSFRIVDEEGTTARRHIPRPGSGSGEQSGEVVSFLGGACAIRRVAFEEVGGYLGELFYAHEELDLAWRLIDAGWLVGYEADLVVEHPHAPISRHADGWRLTGRNRVVIARRNLPWPIAVAHVIAWLALGLLRAPDRSCRRSYFSGWRAGWNSPIERRPISWRTAWRLTRLGRPPLI